jgi:hypothetical protein
MGPRQQETELTVFEFEQACAYIDEVQKRNK